MEQSINWIKKYLSKVGNPSIKKSYRSSSATIYETGIKKLKIITDQGTGRIASGINYVTIDGVQFTNTNANGVLWELLSREYYTGTYYSYTIEIPCNESVIVQFNTSKLTGTKQIITYS